MPIANTSLGFPTLGEAIHFAFDAFGVLPRKRGNSEDFDEKTKKKIQKALSRLASEEGDLNEQFAQIVMTLSGVVAGVTSNRPVLDATGEIIADMVGVYNYVLRHDGSYRDKAETVRWFLSNYVVSRLVLSLNKHLLALNVAATGLEVPEDRFWYLPTIQNDVVTWPLEKAMRWAYSTVGTSQTHFHYPGKEASSSSFEQQQNLDSATNWLRGKNLPSCGALLWNFTRSFQHLRANSSPKYQRIVPEDRQDSIRLILFIARACTFISRAIHDRYGLAYLSETCDQYRRYSAYIQENVSDVKSSILQLLGERNIPPDQVDAARHAVVSDYWQWFAYREHRLVAELDGFLASNRTTAIAESTIKALVERYGAFAVRPVFEFLERQGSHQIPEGFGEQLLKGFDLKASTTTADEDIARYESELDASGVRGLLPWMVPWLKAVRAYRLGDYETAFGHYQEAFTFAQYCAGESQYGLVNQYVDVSAKTNRWREFKKAASWARYLGLEVRWLRGAEPTEENLRGVFELMKKVQYAHL